jgi:hypothetical protein
MRDNLLALVALISVLCASAAAEPKTLRLHGVVVGQERLASIHVPGNGTPQWFAENQRAGDFVILRIENNKVVLRNEQGEVTDLFLVGSRTVDGKDSENGPFSRKWINSRDNPMLLQPQEISSRLAKAWGTMTSEERSEIEAFYLKHGWRMVRVEVLAGGGFSVEWENVYQEERQRRVQENRDRFVSGLSESQKALWDELATPRMRVRVGDDFTDEQKRDLENSKKLSERFLRTLSAEQEADRATILDFTKGNW